MKSIDDALELRGPEAAAREAQLTDSGALGVPTERDESIGRGISGA